MNKDNQNVKNQLLLTSVHDIVNSKVHVL